MKYITALIFSLTLSLSANQASAAACGVKALKDAKDGAIYYDKDHRLYKFVEIDKSKGDKLFCSSRDAERAGYEEAPERFANSTARLVECVESGVKSCMGYVIGQYRSLAIYDRACGGDVSQTSIINNFVSHAKADKNRMDTEKFYGTTGALIDAFPCGGARIARKQ